MTERGKFIVLYGANNLGKSTQVELLVKPLRGLLPSVESLKYPVYRLGPTGPILNAALREGLVISDLELQRQFAKNRRDYEPRLKVMLENGTWVIGEDYTGTGIAWGMTHGISRDVMEKMNKELLREDLAILLDGERFTRGIERGHRHEESYVDWALSRKIHLELSERYGWKVVDALGSPEQVHRRVVDIIKQELSVAQRKEEK